MYRNVPVAKVRSYGTVWDSSHVAVYPLLSRERERESVCVCVCVCFVAVVFVFCLRVNSGLVHPHDRRERFSFFFPFFSFSLCGFLGLHVCNGRLGRHNKQRSQQRAGGAPWRVAHADTVTCVTHTHLSLIHISEPTRLA